MGRFDLALGKRPKERLVVKKAPKKNIHCIFAIAVNGDRKAVQHSRKILGTVGQATLPCKGKGFLTIPLFQRTAKDLVELRRRVHKAVDEVFDNYASFQGTT